MSALSPGMKAPFSGIVPPIQPNEVGVITFYKETCPTCMLGLPYIEKLYLHHRNDSNIKFLAVAQEDRAGADRFSKQFGITMPTSLDSKPYSASDQYGLTNVPTTFLVRGDGTIEQTTVGFIKKDYETLAQKLAAFTKKSPAPIFQGVTVPELKPG